MYFPSKKDKWITVIVWVIPLLGVIAPLVKGEFTAAFIMLLLGLFLLWFWFKTGYKIDGDKIRIFYGPIRQTVHIKEIEVIVKSKAPLTAPALSMDRIQIRCGRYDVFSISPEDQQKFLDMLTDINPEISLDTRLDPNK
ncbi:PH domain-containing protein [Oceanobacillus saliphilus]|uniref:PH domain-containing protein n=1 Tax=Oceanobacillus saliphilus TaxID=2925834 RepID=UPI00201E29B1|nr:PH domain-containing protein [Oceanobacillus saliphilus]